MKVSPEQREVTFDSTSSVSAMRIDASAVMFDILSKKLYVNPKTAVLRELASNCYDSHVKAGKAHVPFEIKLPSLLNRQLSFKDFGTGMTPDIIEKVYTIYGASSKTGDNSEIGGFGLGAKSFFAITDKATIITRVDGTQWVWFIFKNSEGIPSYSMVSATSTVEPNGTEILLDLGFRYTEEDLLVLRGFNPLPLGVNLKPMKLLLDTPSWGLLGDPEEISHIAVGPIVYELSYDFRSVVGRHRHGCRFKFGIGELDLVPSREYLMSNAKNNKALTDRCALIETEEHLVHEIQKDWDVRTCYLFYKAKLWPNECRGVSFDLVLDPIALHYWSSKRRKGPKEAMTLRRLLRDMHYWIGYGIYVADNFKYPARFKALSTNGFVVLRNSPLHKTLLHLGIEFKEAPPFQPPPRSNATRDKKVIDFSLEKHVSLSSVTSVDYYVITGKKNRWTFNGYSFLYDEIINKSGPLKNKYRNIYGVSPSTLKYLLQVFPHAKCFMPEFTGDLKLLAQNCRAVAPFGYENLAHEFDTIFRQNLPHFKDYMDRETEKYNNYTTIRYFNHVVPVPIGPKTGKEDDEKFLARYPLLAGCRRQRIPQILLDLLRKEYEDVSTI